MSREIANVLYLVEAKGRRKWILQTKEEEELGKLAWRGGIRWGAGSASADGQSWTFRQGGGVGGVIDRLGERRGGTTEAFEGDGKERPVARLSWKRKSKGQRMGQLTREGRDDLFLAQVKPLKDGQPIQGIDTWMLRTEDEARRLDFSWKKVNSGAAKKIFVDVHPAGSRDPDAVLLILLCCHVLQRANAYIETSVNPTFP